MPSASRTMAAAAAAAATVLALLVAAGPSNVAAEGASASLADVADRSAGNHLAEENDTESEFRGAWSWDLLQHSILKQDEVATPAAATATAPADPATEAAEIGQARTTKVDAAGAGPVPASAAAAAGTLLLAAGSALATAAAVAAAVAATAAAVATASYLLLLGPKGKRSVGDAAAALLDFYRAFFYFLRGGSFEHCPHFPGSAQARCHVYSLALVFYIWDRPHYRNGTFQDDMIKNLRDVALPGTGVPLDLVARSKLVTFLFMTVGYPVVAAVAAVNRGRFDAAAVAAAFVEQLLEPQDWFSFWRLNCRLATLHASLTTEPDYELEDKWKFLTVAEERNVAVTPYMKVAGIVCKHRNEEGGLGFESFDNASEGGDWIIQRKLDNGPFLNAMLPPNAPLSTFRIISASRGGLKCGTAAHDQVTMDDVQALSCVWRAGRAEAKTDHSAILFNVDPNTGVIKRGTTNVHWYQRGLSKVFTTPWTSEHNHTHHPDSGQLITGVQIPNMKEMMDFVRDAHLRLIPHVPLCGWDVALTADDGMLLLEGNFSCNFFRGDFDKAAYFDFVGDYFVDCERRIARQEDPANADQ